MRRWCILALVGALIVILSIVLSSKAAWAQLATDQTTTAEPAQEAAPAPTDQTAAAPVAPADHTTEAPTDQAATEPVAAPVQEAVAPADQTAAPLQETAPAPAGQPTEAPANQAAVAPADQTAPAPAGQPTEAPANQTVAAPSDEIMLDQTAPPPVQETVAPVVEPVQETVAPVVEPVQDTVAPVVEPVQETVAPVVAEGVPQRFSNALNADVSVSVRTEQGTGVLDAALLAAGSYSAPTQGDPKTLSPAAARLAVGMRGSGPIEAVSLVRPLTQQILFGYSTSTFTSFPTAGGSPSQVPPVSPVPTAPAGSSSSGGSGSSVTSGAGGAGLPLGILTAVLALSPLVRRMLRYPPDFFAPNSALKLAVERPG